MIILLRNILTVPILKFIETLPGIFLNLKCIQIYKIDVLKLNLHHNLCFKNILTNVYNV